MTDQIWFFSVEAKNLYSNNSIASHFTQKNHHHARLGLHQVGSLWIRLAICKLSNFVFAGRFGGPDVVKLGEHPKPALGGPNDVLVQVHAAALNPVRVDRKIYEPLYVG